MGVTNAKRCMVNLPADATKIYHLGDCVYGCYYDNLPDPGPLGKRRELRVMGYGLINRDLWDILRRELFWIGFWENGDPMSDARLPIGHADKWIEVQVLFASEEKSIYLPTDCSRFFLPDKPIFINSVIGSYVSVRRITGLNALSTVNVTDMSLMFTGHMFFDDPLETFDTSQVTNMRGMFASCNSFNSHLANFNTANVKDMSWMFYYDGIFNQSIDSFDTYSVETTEGMFYNCLQFNQPVNHFNTFQLQDSSFMFFSCVNFDQPVSNFNTGSIHTLRSMFEGCNNFNQSVSNFDTSNVTTMRDMFYGCPNFNQSVSNFNTSNVTTMRGMFGGCSNFNQSVSNFDTSNVTTMRGMFSYCTNFNQPVSNFDTSQVTDMNSMFSYCTNFNQSVGNFDTSQVTNMRRFFFAASDGQNRHIKIITPILGSGLHQQGEYIGDTGFGSLEINIPYDYTWAIYPTNFLTRYRIENLTTSTTETVRGTSPAYTFLANNHYKVTRLN